MLINTGNISRKVLSKVLRSFDKNFERLHTLKVVASKPVVRKSIKTAKVTVKTATYNGSPQKPGVTVKLGNTTLKSGTDYTVTYSNTVSYTHLTLPTKRIV